MAEARSTTTNQKIIMKPRTRFGNPLGSLARSGWSLLVGALVSLNVFVSANAGTFSTDFNSGTPAGGSVNGTAIIDATGGVGDSGVLKLTTADNSQQGSFVINDLDGGAAVSGFTA